MSFFALLVSPYFLGLDRVDAFDVGCDYLDLLLHAAVAKDLLRDRNWETARGSLFLLNFRFYPIFLANR